MRVSGLSYLFPQHCIMLAFTHEEHATAVNNKLKEAILSLNKKAKKRLLEAIVTSTGTMTITINAPTQRMDEPHTSKGVTQGQRVATA